MKPGLKEAGEQIAYNYSAIALAQLLSMPLYLFYLSLITRMLGPERFGQFTIFLASAQLFFCLFINWNRNSIIRFGSEAYALEKNLGEVIGSQAMITMFCLILALATILLMRNYLRDILHLSARIYSWIVLYLFAYVLSDFTHQFLMVRQRMRAYAYALVSRRALLLILFSLVFVAFKLRPYISGVIIIEIISYLAVLGLFFSIAFPQRSLFARLCYSKEKIKEMLTYSWPFVITVILGYCLLWADIWMIKFFLHYRAVGEYGAANRLMQLVANTIMPLSIVIFPLVVAFRSVGADSLIYTFATKIVPQLCFFWSLAIVILLFTSKSIIQIMFGEGFLAALVPFQLLLLGLSFQILSFLFTSTLQAYDRAKRLALIALIAVTVNLSLNFILIPRWGIIGASLSKAATLIIVSLLYTNSALRCLGAPRNNYTVYGFLSIPFLAVLFLCGLDNNFLRLAAMVFICGLSIIFVKKTKVFSKEAWSFWEKIKLPAFIRIVFKKIYWALA